VTEIITLRDIVGMLVESERYFGNMQILRRVTMLGALAACSSGNPPPLVDMMGQPGVCNVLAQTGCDAGQKCTWIIDDAMMRLGHIGCAPATGTVTDGMMCSFLPPAQGGYDDCIQGHYCFSSDDVTGICKQICDQQGGLPMCGTGFACQLYEGLFGPIGMEAAGVCDTECDPLDDNDFDGSGTRLSKTGTKCTQTQGCYPQFSKTAPRRSDAVCLNIPKMSVNLFHNAPCTHADGCATSQESPYLNGCAQGFRAVVSDNTTGSNSYACRSLCALADCYLGNCGTVADPAYLGVAPHRCNAQDSTAATGESFAPGPSGDNCVAVWWIAEQDKKTGTILASAFSDKLGICLAHKDFRYDSNHDGRLDGNDATFPDCSTLPIVETAPGLGARQFGCVKATTSTYPVTPPGFTSSGIWIEAPRLPYSDIATRN
jgi:hypothetical protein